MTAGATATAATRARRRLVVLPCLRASGAEQMSLDERLLDEAPEPVARRYEWDPPAVSLGKFQRLPGETAGAVAERGMGRPPVGLDVVRRPTGGRAVLHGAGFEWSFALVIPLRLLGSSTARAWQATAGPSGPVATAGSAGTASPRSAYDLVCGAFAAALARCGVELDAAREAPYQRSGLCFASALRHDLLIGGEKVVAVAQARRGGTVLVHGSVLLGRPPAALLAELERLVGEPWHGEGLAGSDCSVAADVLWSDVLTCLATALDARVHDSAPCVESRPQALLEEVSLA